MARTKYMTKAEAERFCLDEYPNAGPNPSISGMKNLYWGEDALCIKCGQYVYKVTQEIYDRAH